MARSVLDVLNDRDELRSIRERVDALGLPNKGAILDAIDSAEVEASMEAGDAVWASEDEQSRLLDHEGKLLRFSRRDGRFEEVEGEDPASIVVGPDPVEEMPPPDELPPPDEGVPGDVMPETGFPADPAMAARRQATPRTKR